MAIANVPKLEPPLYEHERISVTRYSDEFTSLKPSNKTLLYDGPLLILHFAISSIPCSSSTAYEFKILSLDWAESWIRNSSTTSKLSGNNNDVDVLNWVLIGSIIELFERKASKSIKELVGLSLQE